jgi:AcrR family transcriptional regulator
MHDNGGQILSRTARRAQTRTRLQRSAGQAVAALGMSAASVEKISESAGFSRGAFYANYRSKEELLLELMANRWQAESMAWRDLAAQAVDAEAMLCSFARRFEHSDAGAHWATLAMELQLHAVRDEVFGRLYRECLGQHHAAVADLFVAIFAKAGCSAPAEPETLAATAMAFGHSLSLQAACGSRQGEPRYAGDMFILFLRGLMALAKPISLPRETIFTEAL